MGERSSECVCSRTSALQRQSGRAGWELPERFLDKQAEVDRSEAEASAGIRRGAPQPLWRGASQGLEAGGSAGGAEGLVRARSWPPQRLAGQGMGGWRGACCMLLQAASATLSWELKSALTQGPPSASGCASL